MELEEGRDTMHSRGRMLTLLMISQPLFCKFRWCITCALLVEWSLYG